ncbi:MAG: YqeG family HAD IIIA-type phosphatase [Lachnospiraceae bacterium]|nr:YqeG family HAD IIIA-type phosphatase [Lachnospiraceae bacterium]
MCLFSSFYPDEIKESAYVIDYEALFDKGYRGIIYDIDNTLVMHGYPADERAIALMETLKQIGFKVTLLSNNKEGRVKMFNDAVNVNYIFKADKPMKKGYLKAMDIMDTDASTTVFIGDQLFTDVWGAKRCGIKNILVKPIDPHEEIQIVLKRKLEAIVLFFYYRRKKYTKLKDR